jgi:hypothetical protein
MVEDKVSGIRKRAHLISVAFAMFSLSTACGGDDSRGRSEVTEEEAIAAARATVQREYPHDVFELHEAKRRDDLEPPSWLVSFAFANNEGSACVLVDERQEAHDTRLVECAFYVDD